jgi:pilus assembly protein CpaB
MGRLRGFLWLAAGAVVAILAGAVAFIALQKGVTERTPGVAAGPKSSVVVAARSVGVRTRLTVEDLALKEIPADAIPEGAVRDAEQAVGMLTLVDLFPGEVILAQRLVDPNVTSGDGRKALILAEEKVLLAFPASDLMSNVAVLKAGDHVDLLLSLDFPVGRVSSPESPAVEGATEEKQTTFSLLQNVEIASIVTQGLGERAEEGPPQAILFALDPEDALLLKYAKDAGGIVDIVLRAPGVDVPFDTEPVDIDYVISRYQIPTGQGR